jgi:type IV fimbrial biogenesis protein FimT
VLEPVMGAGGQRGLTLIELLVTFVIVGVLATVAVPAVVEINAKMRVDGVAGELRTDLQYARTEALRLRETVNLTVNANGSGYTVSGAVSGTTLKTVSLPSGAALTAATTLGFDGMRGFASTTGLINVTASRTDASQRVSVDAAGRVTACAVSGSFYGVRNSC